MQYFGVCGMCRQYLHLYLAFDGAPMCEDCVADVKRERAGDTLPSAPDRPVTSVTPCPEQLQLGL